MRQIRYLLLFILTSMSVCAGELVLNYDDRLLGWSTDEYLWTYNLDTHNWSWTQDTHVWTYDADLQIFTDETSNEQWIYDATYDVWVRTFTGVYDLETASTFAHVAWRYDADDERWYLVERSYHEDEGYSFDTVTSAYWMYDAVVDEWSFTRTGGGLVSDDETWTFDAAASQWLQHSPDNELAWTFRSDETNGEWIESSSVSDDWWIFQLCTSTVTRYMINGDTPEALYDKVWWELDVTTGAWQQKQVQNPNTVGATVDWEYDALTSLWNPAGDALTTKKMPLSFPPTPFAHYQAVIEATTAALLADGVLLGSDDGSGAGLMDAESSQFLPSGVFTFADITQMTWDGVITVAGDVEFHVMQDSVLTIGSGEPASSVTVTPTAGATVSHLLFNVDEGVELEVQVLSDLAFLARDDLRLYLSFRGQGTTRFRLPSGRVLSFGPSDPEDGAAGVCVQVLMEQYADDVAAARYQVIFEPWSYAQESGDDAVNTATNTTTWIQFGRYSCLRFISANAEGVDEDIWPGYGSVAFDVVHEGIGRTIILLSRGSDAYDGSDAGINVVGYLVEGTGDDGAVLASDVSGDQVKAHKYAGIGARLAITDGVALASIVSDIEDPTLDEALAWVDRGVDARRGLVVLNYNQSFPRLACNLERAATLEESNWAQSQAANGYQPGFILGGNGRVDIEHNVFLDYVGASSNVFVDPEYLGGTETTDAQVKWRNPSALIIDGLGSFDPSEDTSWDMEYAGTSQALISLRGTSGLFLRCGASASTGTLVNDIQVSDEGDERLDATIGNGFYNGTFCPVVDSKGVQSVHESILLDLEGNPLLNDGDELLCLDGEHVLCCEGPLTIASVMGRFGCAPNGFVNPVSLAIDHTGQEVGEVEV